MEKTKYTFFFILLLAIAFVSAHITIKPNVQFSFGCDASLPLPQNCSGNYYFKTTLLNNESPQYSFFDIKLYSNYSMWDNKTICRPTPFYQYVYTYPDIFNWECCISNWVEYNTTCDTTDHNTKYYLDSNNCLIPNGLPADNGTIQSCNYCSEDLFQYVGECTENSTQTIDYTDLNKFTCCDVTNISTDCSILTFPYNETTYQDCNSPKANIGTLNCEVNPHLSPFEKQDCVAEIPVQYMSLGESYKCVSYVKDKLSGEIVQVNPENQTLPVRESRLYFEPMGSVVNFYYTSKNLKAKAYDIGVECSSASRILYSEQPINAQYEDLSFVFTRSEWLGMNAGYLALGMVLLLIIVLGFVVYFGWLKK